MVNKKLKINKSTVAFIDWANVYGWKKTLGWEVDIDKLFAFLNGYSKIISKNFYFGIEKGQTQSENFMIKVQTIGFTAVSKEVKWTPVSLESSHFKKIVKDLFDVLDDIKNNNSEFSNKLYDLTKKIDSLQQAKTNHDSITVADGQEVKEIYDLIEELDNDLKKLNITIDSLQSTLKIPVLRRKCDFDVEIARDALNLLNTYEVFMLWSGDGDYAALTEDLLKKGKKVVVIFAPGHKGKEYDGITDSIKTGKINGSLFLCPVNKLKGLLQK
ncbi:MAG: NYN domain-containing protein [Candidatus Falkowbacteria bacterium]